jgi:hypothetical protein
MSKHRNKPPKFRDIWANQTMIGKRFGLSAIAVGQVLKDAGLKDPATGDATPRALAEGFAVATPLQDGKPFFLWSIEKVGALIGARHEPLSRVEYWVREVRAALAPIEKAWEVGDDKAACIMSDCLYDDVPSDIKAEVRARIEPAEDPREAAPPAALPTPVDDAVKAPWEA